MWCSASKQNDARELLKQHIIAEWSFSVFSLCFPHQKACIDPLLQVKISTIFPSILPTLIHLYIICSWRWKTGRSQEWRNKRHVSLCSSSLWQSCGKYCVSCLLLNCFGNWFALTLWPSDCRPQSGLCVRVLKWVYITYTLYLITVTNQIKEPVCRNYCTGFISWKMSKG